MSVETRALSCGDCKGVVSKERLGIMPEYAAQPVSVFVVVCKTWLCCQMNAVSSDSLWPLSRPNCHVHVVSSPDMDCVVPLYRKKLKTTQCAVNFGLMMSHRRQA